MTKKRSTAEIEGATRLSELRAEIGKRPGKADRAAMRGAYHGEEVPEPLRKRIRKVTR